MYFGGGVWVSGKSLTPAFTTTFLSKIGNYLKRLAMSKACSKCGLEKPFSEFGTAKAIKRDGYNSWCKQCVRDTAKKYRDSVIGIYSAIKGRQKYYKTHQPTKHKPFNITRKDFIMWYNSQTKECHYCRVSEENANILLDSQLQHNERLTIDCKDNSKGYVLDNIVFACGRCNFNKGDFFTHEEWIEIAQKYIRPRWEKLLAPTIPKERKE